MMYVLHASLQKWVRFGEFTLHSKRLRKAQFRGNDCRIPRLERALANAKRLAR